LKRYRPTRELFAEIDRVLHANRPSFKCSPLDTVIDLLCRGRHYSWMGIYLSAEGEDAPHPLGAGGDGDPGRMALSGTRRKILISMKIASREVGVLSAESPRENAFRTQDRVLLEKVAARLAQFLTGPGKYIVRHARGTASLTGAAKVVPEAKK
jgi:hypothetical protein